MNITAKIVMISLKSWSFGRQTQWAAPTAIQRTSNACFQYSVSKAAETKAQPAVGWEVAPAVAAAVPPLIAAAATNECSYEKPRFSDERHKRSVISSQQNAFKNMR